MDLTFSLDELVFFFCIMIRITGFVYTAPFFTLKNVPRHYKVGLSLALALVMYHALPYEPLVYNNVVDFALIVVKEVLAGVTLGFLGNICYQILSFSGQLIDMEIGFSMVNEYDPVTSATVTINSNLLNYSVMLVMMITFMHHYIVQALVDCFTVVPVGGVSFDPDIYKVAVKFIIDYFVIAFRIVLPVFAALLIVNTVLAILAKVSPQMNMFVVGMQLKVIVGLLVLYFVVQMIPSISDFIFNEMMEVMRDAVYYMRG